MKIRIRGGVRKWDHCTHNTYTYFVIVDSCSINGMSYCIMITELGGTAMYTHSFIKKYSKEVR